MDRWWWWRRRWRWRWRSPPRRTVARARPTGAAGTTQPLCLPRTEPRSARAHCPCSGKSVTSRHISYHRPWVTCRHARHGLSSGPCHICQATQRARSARLFQRKTDTPRLVANQYVARIPTGSPASAALCVFAHALRLSIPSGTSGCPTALRARTIFPLASELSPVHCSQSLASQPAPSVMTI